jgi:hypothetical protein
MSKVKVPSDRELAARRKRWQENVEKGIRAIRETLKEGPLAMSELER